MKNFKNLFSFFVLFFGIISVQSQVTSVIKLGGIIGEIEFKGDDLYIGYYAKNKVSKINTTVANPTLTDVVKEGDITYASGLEFSGNTLYTSSEISGAYKINDVTSSNIQPEAIVDIPSAALVLNGNNLYFVNYLKNKLYRIDIIAEKPTAQEILTITAPTAIAINGNYLYVASKGDDDIHKIDLSSTTPTAVKMNIGLSNVRGMIFDGNNMYVSTTTRTPTEDEGKIYKIDISASSSKPVQIANGFANPIGGLAIKGTDLYIADYVGISKLDLSNIVLSTEDYLSQTTTTISPNPSSDFILISSSAKVKNYTIYNNAGQIVLKGKLPENNRIDIRNLSLGAYILHLDESGTSKFIKK